MEDKTVFTLEHARRLYQTIADIFGEKYNVEITANVSVKEDIDGKEN
jgi:hypothetical protein